MWMPGCPTRRLCGWVFDFPDSHTSTLGKQSALLSPILLIPKILFCLTFCYHMLYFPRLVLRLHSVPSSFAFCRCLVSAHYKRFNKWLEIGR
jgi:hypothetical protein